jgi:predicted Zn-dependent protease
MSYNGTALSEQFENGRRSGSLETIPGSLSFKSDSENAIKMPLSGIEMRIGGAGNRYVFFTHPRQPGLTFYTDDRSILKSNEIRFEPGLQEVLTKLRNRKRGIWTGIGIVAALFIAAIVALIMLRGSIVEHIAGLVPPAQEQQISEEMLATAIAGKTVLKDSAIMAELQRITGPLTAAVNDTAFHFTFTIVKDPVLNAFALPGGAVVIHSGLIEKANSAEEVAGVLAHEISHVTRRHHLRGIINNMGIFLVIRALLGDIAGLSADIATAGAALSSLKYSRDFEREADDNGLMLLEKSGISTDGMVSFFETMGKEGPDLGVADVMSTHPATSERIARLKKQRKTGLQTKPIPVDFSAFKKQVQSYFNDKK